MNPPAWTALHFDCGPETLGFLPTFLDLDDLRPAAQQFNERYAHGGGWQPTKIDLTMHRNWQLTYPGDPPYLPLAAALLRDETIILYTSSWVVIMQPDGSWEACRMD